MSKGIEVSDDTWSSLTILKAKMFAESLDAVVDKLLEVGEQKILDEIKVKNKNF